MHKGVGECFLLPPSAACCALCAALRILIVSHCEVGEGERRGEWSVCPRREAERGRERRRNEKVARKQHGSA